MIAVSKSHSVTEIMEAYNAGQRCFGENKVQELVLKASALPDDIEWHMVGHLQSNKVKYIAPFVKMIHGVDSMKLLNTINKEAAKQCRVIPCLLQVHIASESTKFGFSPTEFLIALQSGEHLGLNNVEIHGLMGMATFTSNQEVIRSEFRFLKSFFEEVQSRFFPDSGVFKEISMGMSDDHVIAISEGSTMIRVGSAIFGVRDY